MLEFTTWLESTALSIWVREAPSMFVFPFILVVHAWGMGFLAGGNAAVGLRILGFAPKVPLGAMQRFYPFMWFGFVINTISGILLLVGYPTKALTNPTFYLKLGSIAVGVYLMIWLRRRVVQQSDFPMGKGRAIAFLSLMMWVVAIFTGRFLAYTCRMLLSEHPC